MVNQHKRDHHRMVVATRTHARVIGRLAAAALLLAGVTSMAVSLTAQPMPDAGKYVQPVVLSTFAADSPPFATPIAMQPDPLQKGVPLPPEMMPKENLPRGVGELPPPIRDIGPDRPGMQSLPESVKHLGSTPRATPDELKEYNKLVDRVIDPGHTLDVIDGRSRIIILKQTPTKIQVVDESIIGHNLLEPKEMLVLGKKAGTTVMTMWFIDPDTKKEKILSYLVRCIPDPERKYRLQQIYKALEIEIHKYFPDSMIRIDMVGDKVMVSGEAKDVQEAVKILQIIRGNIPNDTQRLAIGTINLNMQAGDALNEQGTPGLSNFVTAGGPNVINMIRIPGEQQVMLRVTVAEVNRTAARSIGLDFTITNNHGTTVFSQQTGGISIPSGGIFASATSSSGGISSNLPVLLDRGQIPLAINALKTLNYARSLAEPNLVAINGQTATFLAGGSFPVPVLGGSGTIGTGSGILSGVQYIPYGVFLNFTPVITDRDRIRLMVRAFVSDRDTSTGASIGGSAVPGLSTRTFFTTVEMREGQTLAIAGLIQNNLATQSNRVPFFGNIPFLNHLFGYDSTQSGEQELVVLVTPELVAPLEKKEVPKLPGSDLFEPSDLEFFVYGRLESRRSADYRSQVMNDPHRMMRYHKAEQIYMFGPVGHTDDPNYPFHPYDQYGREIRTAPPGGKPKPPPAGPPLLP